MGSNDVQFRAGMSGGRRRSRGRGRGKSMGFVMKSMRGGTGNRGGPLGTDASSVDVQMRAGLVN